MIQIDDFDTQIQCEELYNEEYQEFLESEQYSRPNFKKSYHFGAGILNSKGSVRGKKEKKRGAGARDT